MQITVAIPHYNSPQTLDDLLSQLERDSFDHIVVLDDHSNDQEIVHEVAAKHPNTEFIWGDKNIGSGGNRNRILRLNIEGVVWFLDCDMEMRQADVAAALRSLFTKYKWAMIGFVLQNVDDLPMQWNYGHEMHPVLDNQFNKLRSQFENHRDADIWHQLQKLNMDYPWLIGEVPPEPRHVDWVAEGSFAIPYSLFAEVGGYDTNFRYHEGQDLARRMRDIGGEVLIHPVITTRHLEVNVSGHRRLTDVSAAQRLFYRKHNILS